MLKCCPTIEQTVLWPFYVTTRYVHHSVNNFLCSFDPLTEQCIKIRERNLRYLTLNVFRLSSLSDGLEFCEREGQICVNSLEILAVNRKRILTRSASVTVSKQGRLHYCQTKLPTKCHSNKTKQVNSLPQQT